MLHLYSSEENADTDFANRSIKYRSNLSRVGDHIVQYACYSIGF